MNLRNVDERVAFFDQLGSDHQGSVLFLNTFNVEPDDVERFLEVWTADAQFMVNQPGFIRAQLYRGIAGSTTFVNEAVWESVAAQRDAMSQPAFQERFSQYPESISAAPHLFAKVAVEGVCEA